MLYLTWHHFRRYFIFTFVHFSRCFTVTFTCFSRCFIFTFTLLWQMLCVLCLFILAHWCRCSGDCFLPADALDSPASQLRRHSTKVSWLVGHLTPDSVALTVSCKYLVNYWAFYVAWTLYKRHHKNIHLHTPHSAIIYNKIWAWIGGRSFQKKERTIVKARCWDIGVVARGTEIELIWRAKGMKKGRCWWRKVLWEVAEIPGSQPTFKLWILDTRGSRKPT